MNSTFYEFITTETQFILNPAEAGLKAKVLNLANGNLNTTGDGNQSYHRPFCHPAGYYLP
jgi:hypothetical protein